MLSRRCVPCLYCLAVVAEFGYYNIVVYTIILQLWAHWFYILVVPWAVMEFGICDISLNWALHAVRDWAHWLRDVPHLGHSWLLAYDGYYFASILWLSGCEGIVYKT